jgi:hypothetical protein
VSDRVATGIEDTNEARLMTAIVVRDAPPAILLVCRLPLSLSPHYALSFQPNDLRSQRIGADDECQW